MRPPNTEITDSEDPVTDSGKTETEHGEVPVVRTVKNHETIVSVDLLVVNSF